MTKTEMIDRIHELYKLTKRVERASKKQLSELDNLRLGSLLERLEKEWEAEQDLIRKCNAKTEQEPVIVPPPLPPTLSLTKSSGGGRRVVKKADGMS